MYTKPYELYISLDDIKVIWQPRTNWRSEPILRAALAALELTFLLIHEACQDVRSTVRRAERIERLFDGSRRQIDLLWQLLNPIHLTEGIGGDQQSLHTNLQRLTCLDDTFGGMVKRCTDLYHSFFDDLPFYLGLEWSVGRLRKRFRLPPQLAQCRKPFIPYDAWIRPQAVAQIFERRNFNPEDRLFATVHQITECWLFLAVDLLQAGEREAGQSHWPAATRHVEKTCSILGYLAEHILLLETMVLADYHPLRVRLRDGSGAQSSQAFELIAIAKRLLAPMNTHLNDQNLSLLEVLHTPEKHDGIYNYIEALGSLEAKIADFFFHHYKLAARILGIESLGSLGYEVRHLVDRFVQPFYPALDQARYNYVLLTNYAHGREAGTIISKLESTPANGRAGEEPANISADRIQEQLAKYFESIRRHDLEGWIDLFEPDGSIEDPEGSRPFRGHSGCRVFFRGFMSVFEPNLALDAKHITIVPERGCAEVEWEVRAKHKGIPVNFAGTEVIHFSPAGKIKSVQVMQDPNVIANQLLAGWKHERTQRMTS